MANYTQNEISFTNEKMVVKFNHHHLFGLVKLV